MIGMLRLSARQWITRPHIALQRDPKSHRPDRREAFVAIEAAGRARACGQVDLVAAKDAVGAWAGETFAGRGSPSAVEWAAGVAAMASWVPTQIS